MKKLLFAPLCFLTVEMFVTAALQAQGTTYISNVGANSQGSAAIANNAWLAQPFTAGTDTQGYSLNSIQLLMNSASGTPSSFSVSLYGNNGSHPGSSFASLTGSANPSTAGVFNYTAPGVTLLPSTTYWIVVTAQTPLSSGAYYSSLASFFDYIASDNWSTDRYYNTSTDGSNWTISDIGYNLQFAVEATAVPEPATYALVGLGLVCLSFWWRKSRQAK